MAEKRGETGKLICDFPTEAVMEVYLNGKWYRTTSKDFRSFDGKRRLTKPIQQPKQGPAAFLNVEFETYDYFGPVYLFGTNKEVPYTGKGDIAKSDIWNHARMISQSRK